MSFLSLLIYHATYIASQRLSVWGSVWGALLCFVGQFPPSVVFLCGNAMLSQRCSLTKVLVFGRVNLPSWFFNRVSDALGSFSLGAIWNYMS